MSDDNKGKRMISTEEHRIRQNYLAWGSKQKRKSKVFIIFCLGSNIKSFLPKYVSIQTPMRVNTKELWISQAEQYFSFL